MSALASPAALYGLPAVASVGLHALVIAMLLVNWTSRSEATITPRVKPKSIEARLVTAESLQPKKKPAKAAPSSASSTNSSRPLTGDYFRIHGLCVAAQRTWRSAARPAQEVRSGV